MMRQFVLYNHGGSENHGCEALVRTVTSLLGENNSRLLSDSPEQDKKYHIDDLLHIDNAISDYPKLSLEYLKSYKKLRQTGDYFDMDTLPYIKALKRIGRDEIAISIGGDNYCYDFYPKFIRMHQILVKRGIKTVLFGCSLEEKLFKDNDFVNDMKSYSLITARESVSYDMLKSHGIVNVKLIPDSAFLLPTEDILLPNGLQSGNMVGINISPLVERKEKVKGIVRENFKRLILYILNNTSLNIALIPHVVWKGNDDRTVLRWLFDDFSNTGRIYMIDDCDCMKLKGYISSCRFFVGSRTHATIAAYSSLVPTLVLGYSVKSRGIAKDLFGTDNNYVVSVESLKEPSQLLESFRWIFNNEDIIRKHLYEVMPNYTERINTLNLEQIINGID